MAPRFHSGKIQLAVGVDAGSCWTRCVICALEDESLRYLGHGLASSAGWVRGRVSDQEAVGESIRAAVGDAERGAQAGVEAATLGIGGAHVRGGQSRGVYEFGRPREIGAEELSFAARRAAEVQLESDRMLLHVFPQDFILDGMAGYRKPQKGICSRLESNVHLVTASILEHQALVAAAHMAHLEVEETVFEPVAAAYACLLAEDREEGVALLDIGLHSSGLAVYDGEALQLAANLPVSGDLFTRDIAAMFKLGYEDAECLKREYGCAMLGLTSDSSIIEVPSPENRPPREARRGELVEILDARAEELFRYALEELRRAGMDRKLLGGLMLTGGGSLLPGMCDMAEKVLNCQAGSGLAQGIGDWPEELENPLWTTAAGLSMYSAKLKLHQPPRRRARGLLGLVMR
ncbi:MAG TPA: cell division protein FtsA [Bryobacteraceae bacterium]|nr:cell division protein FtsA [Bryobacteraceae bacterium]